MVRVALRHFRILMSHQPLDRIGIDAVLAEPRREGVPQIMKTAVLDAGPGQCPDVELCTESIVDHEASSGIQPECGREWYCG